MLKTKKYFFHETAIVDSHKIGENTRIWGFTHIMENVVIGQNCNIGEHCFIESDSIIGNNVVVKNGISIWTGIVIEDGAFLGPNIVLTNDLNPRSGYARPLSKILIRRGATIGAGSVILPNTEIGEYSMVGAGSVVTKSTKPNSLVYGNPARHKGWVCKCGIKLNITNSLLCDCGKKYSLNEMEELIEI